MKMEIVWLAGVQDWFAWPGLCLQNLICVNVIFFLPIEKKLQQRIGGRDATFAILIHRQSSSYVSHESKYQFRLICGTDNE